jgi:hypothetical protein
MIKNRSALKPLVFFILTITCCILVRASAFASLIDAKFKIESQLMSESEKSKVNLESPNSMLGFLYKNLFAKSMYSKCRWLPSDSKYLNIKTSECGSGIATIKAVGRFLDEFDADMLTTEKIIDQGHMKFFDFDEGCNVF